MKTVIFRPNALTSIEKDILVSSIFEVHKFIFSIPDKDDFIKYILPHDEHESVVIVHYNAKNIVIGYCFMHFFIKDLAGESTTILRMEMGMLEAYRHNNSNMYYIIKHVIDYWVRNKSRPIYFLGSLVHPSSYSLAIKILGEQYVHPSIINDKNRDIIATQLSRVFYMKPVDPLNPFVVHVGWITKEHVIYKNSFAYSAKASVQFFIKNNPEYGQGYGLVTVIPINFKTARKALINFTVHYINKKILRY